jgi:signal transduction histidine kinase
LTLLYGALFLLAGTVLLGITYLLVAHEPSPTGTNVFIARTPGPQVQRALAVPTLTMRRSEIGVPPSNAALVQLRAYAGSLTHMLSNASATFKAQNRADLNHQRASELGSLLTWSGVALGIMAVLSIGLGWLMAGRALRPVRTMSARARGISERNLHERLALDGPDDELKELGDTFDGLLGRLEAAFESQRRFVANASHELRTPITLERMLVEVALADPRASVDSLRDACARVLVAGEQQERLIESLLTLARSQRGLESQERLDLAELVGGVLTSVDAGEVSVQSELGEAWTWGDAALIERLAANLLDNGIHHNQAGGWVRVCTEVRDGWPLLSVANSGQVVPGDQVQALVEPFRRLNGDRTRHANGHGLGLSIVRAIATAHRAQLHAAPRPGGGLVIEVRFPPA